MEVNEKMNRLEWKWAYIKRLVIDRGLTYQMALDSYNGGKPHDVRDDPEMSADDELNYMASDG